MYQFYWSYPKEQYRKVLADHITVAVEDLTPNELALINKAFDIFEGNLADLKVEQDEVKRLSIELANLKASLDDKDYDNIDEKK
jgi:ABC-type uncharacterized transport system ATPase subunit